MLVLYFIRIQCLSSNDHELGYYLPANKFSRTKQGEWVSPSPSGLVKSKQMKLIWLP